MAINEYVNSNGKIHFEVYLNTFDANGKRVQVRRRGFQSLREAKAGEFDLKRELVDQKERGPMYKKRCECIYGHRHC